MIETTLEIKKNYDNFFDFYSENKTLIYKNVISISTETLKKEEFDNFHLQMTVKGNIEGFETTTVLSFDLPDLDSLLSEVLPYFEENEEYEICQQILDLTKLLSSNNKKM